MSIIKRMIVFFRNISVRQYLYLNYFCNSVQKTGKGKIIPYKYAVINIEKNAKIIVGKSNLEIGVNRLKGSKAETRIRLRDNAVWNAVSGCEVSYGSTIEVLKNAIFYTKYFTMNSNCTLIAAKEIRLGEDVMIARNVVIYDSDFHVINSDAVVANPVDIGDHVWIGTNSMILKGVTIGDGSVIAANTLVAKAVDDKTLVRNLQTQEIIKTEVYWKR